MREQDMICRYGGEEFAILLPETGSEGARRAMERLRLALASLRIPAGAGEIHVSASIGVTTSRPSDGNLDETLARADRALYQAKTTGRDRVVMADEVPETSAPRAPSRFLT